MTKQGMTLQGRQSAKHLKFRRFGGLVYLLSPYYNSISQIYDFVNTKCEVYVNNGRIFCVFTKLLLKREEIGLGGKTPSPTDNWVM